MPTLKRTRALRLAGCAMRFLSMECNSVLTPLTEQLEKFRARTQKICRASQPKEKDFCSEK